MNKINKLILESFKDDNPKPVGDIARDINKPLSSLFYSLQNLISNKELIKTEFGIYQITEIGKLQLKIEAMRNEKI